MFTKKQGKTKFMFLPMTASTEVLAGTVMAFSGGKLIIATSTTAPSEIIGVLRHKIDSTDADYATDLRLVEIEVPVENYVTWEATATGTAVVTDIGLYCDISTADGTTTTTVVNRAASTYDVVQVVGFVSTTKLIVVLNTGVAGCGVIGA
jgi:hypothetical protein